MSYVPYHPDVWPPSEPEIDLRPKIRALRWACAFVLYLLLIAGWVYWMKLPPKIQPPLATIHLADGSELRLVDARVGNNMTLSNSETFGNRIHAPPNDYQSRTRVTDHAGGVWLALSRYHPERKTFNAPSLESITIHEEGSPYALHPSRTDHADGAYAMVLFPAVPRRASTWQIEVKHGGKLSRATIPNPIRSARPAGLPPVPANHAGSSKPAPLPQELQSGGFTARLENVTLGVPRTLGAAPAMAQPHMRVTHHEAKPGTYQQSYEWFDPSGNVVKNGILPWSENVWGLRVKVTETARFPISAERRITLGAITTPGPGQAVALPVPPEMRAEGITDIFVIGSGSYTWAGNRLMPAGSPQGGTRAEVLKSSLNVRYGSLSESAWGIYLLGTTTPGKNSELRTQLRVQEGEAVCTHGSSGSSSWNHVRQRHFSNYRNPKNGPIPVGSQVTIDVFTPATHTFDFLFPRPAHPAAK